jgi:TonB family protein
MDLANYSMQIGAVILAGSVAPLLLRVRRPDVMLVYRQTLLAACLLLPFLQTWNHPAIDSSVTVSIGAATVTQASSPGRSHLSWEEIAAMLLCAGVLARLCWLGIGFARLWRYRTRAEVLAPAPPVFDALQRRLGVWPSICLSGEVSGPVTFGIREPVILLPAEFLAMPYGAQEAIACHELTHVRRRDWAAAMIEELVRAVLWFHPGIWWLLGQIQLAREQTVDAQVIGITECREQYIDALLAVAGGDLVPATLFLRKNHLAQRVAIILKEVSMSKKRLLSSLAAICGALVITARFATLYFPISAPAQEVVRGGDNLLHRAPIDYPADAVEKGIQGTVVVEATLDGKGVVTDARVISGPDPLRRAALKSVLDWHYAAQAQSPVEVAVDFKLPVQQTRIEAFKTGGPIAQHEILSGTLREIKFAGVSPSVTQAVLSKLPVHVEDKIVADVNPFGQFMGSLRQAIEEVDQHLGLNLHMQKLADSGQYYFILEIHYMAAYKAALDQAGGAVEPIRDAQGAVQRIRVGANVQAQMSISTPPPFYPPLAKQARIQGVVRLDAIIGKDGTMKDLRAASGHPLLVPAALEAVRQWVYKPTLLNGNPVEVVSVVDVNFTLSQ